MYEIDLHHRDRDLSILFLYLKETHRVHFFLSVARQQQWIQEIIDCYYDSHIRSFEKNKKRNETVDTTVKNIIKNVKLSALELDYFSHAN